MARYCESHLANRAVQCLLPEAEKSFEQQKHVLEHIEQGVCNQDALQAACPGVGYRFIAAARGQPCSESEEHWHRECP